MHSNKNVNNYVQGSAKMRQTDDRRRYQMRQIQQMRKKRKQQIMMLRLLCGLGVLVAGIVIWRLVSTKETNGELNIADSNYSNSNENNVIIDNDTVNNNPGENNVVVHNNTVYNNTVAQDDNQNPYEKIYYYEADNQERYEAYAAQYSDLSVEDVIWRVNSNLDKPFYSDVYEISLKDIEVFANNENSTAGSTYPYPYPLVINKYNKLPDDYVPENLVSLKSGSLVTAETKEAFDLMCVDAENLDYTLNAASGYRSITYQKDLYNRYLQSDLPDVVDTYSARAGHSEHHTGRAIDISTKNGSILDFENTAESVWVNENAYKYGFIVRYPEDATDITGYKFEPWHITYVGIDISMAMKEKNIATLEEYVIKYISD